MFYSYVPKDTRGIKAVQVTSENAGELAELLMGRLLPGKTSTGEWDVDGVVFPTLDGNKTARISQWIVRLHAGAPIVMDDIEFKDRYDRNPLMTFSISSGVKN